MTITQSIVDCLGRRIIRGDVNPDVRGLVEQDIIDEFGATRNIVREAVKILSGKNLLRSERRVGMIVQPSHKWNLLDPQIITWMLSEEMTYQKLMTALSELRMIIEPAAAALVAQRANSKQILHLFDCYEDMKRFANDPDQAVIHDIRYHETLLEATGNPLLRSLSSSISLLLQANFKLSIQVDNAFIRNLEDHLKIVEAIQLHRPEKARRAMIKLLNKNQKDLEEIKRSV